MPDWQRGVAHGLLRADRRSRRLAEPHPANALKVVDAHAAPPPSRLSVLPKDLGALPEMPRIARGAGRIGPGDRTGARSSCVALAHPKRRGSASIRPAPMTACARWSAHWPPETMEASDTAAAVEPHAGIRREMQAPPGKLVLLIVSTVFGALLIRRPLHRPIVPAWVGKEAEANHGNSSLSETSTLIGLRLHRRQASPTVLGDQLGIGSQGLCACGVSKCPRVG